MFGWLRNLSGKRPVTGGKGAARPQHSAPSTQHSLRARYDAAQTTPENQRNWVGADALDANAAASPEVRATLRQRGRYEQFNNPYTDGMLQTLAGYVVGSGPRLQMLTGVEKVDSLIEQEFADWADMVRLGQKIRLMVETRAAAGEAIGIKRSNPKLPTPVKLDLTLYEGDQMGTPDGWGFNPRNRVDGIEFDQWNNPTYYHLLRQHPGDTRFPAGLALEYDRIPAEDVIHLFKQRRPGQCRGIPQITSALPLFNERRGFRQSVLTAAKIASEMGAVLLKSNASPEEDDLDAAQPWSTQEIERGMMTALPLSYDATQLKPEQPTTTYGEFDDRLIVEGGRPLQMPSNMTRGDSSKHNYASGRLDHQTFFRAIDIEHSDLELEILNRVLGWWMAEALLIPGYLPYRTQFLVARRIPHDWLWRGAPQDDPVKAAEAQKTRLGSQTSTVTDELAGEGVDVEVHFTKLARERALQAKLGLVADPVFRGAELQAALNVLVRLHEGAITPAAAVELLVALGMARKQATAAVSQAPAAEPDDPVSDDAPAEPPEEPPASAQAGRNGHGKPSRFAEVLA